MKGRDDKGFWALSIALAAALAAIAPRAWATVYYVDAEAGSDANAGTGEDAPLRTLAEAATLPLQPGDSVLLRRGSVFREGLAVVRSGTEEAPIEFGAYGEGDAPILDGADEVAAWTSLGGGLWSAPLPADPEIVFFDGALGARRELEADLIAAGDWLYDAGAAALVVYAATSPTGVAAGARHNEIYAWDVHDVVLRDLEIRHAVDAVGLGDTNRVVLERLVLRDNAGWGAVAIAAATSGKGEGNAVVGCEIAGTSATLASAADGNYGSGVFVWGEGIVRANLIADNDIHDNGGHGVGLMESSKNTVSGNAIYRCGWSGIAAAGETTSANVIERNRVFDNCRLVDDCFGVNLFRTGDDNALRFNEISAQHDTLIDTDVPVNEGYPQKYGTGGLRFDGGDPTLGVGNDYILCEGNRAYYNVIASEYNGVDIFNFAHVDLANNTVVDSAANGIVVMTNNSSGVSVTGTKVRNNIVAFAGEHLLAHVSAVDSIVDYNLYFPDAPTALYLEDGAAPLSTDLAGFKAATGFDAHSLAKDPLFVDADAADFHLRKGSPAIDCGADAGLSEDPDGVAVPQGAAPDIGAHEFEIDAGDASADGGADGGSMDETRDTGCGCHAIFAPTPLGLLALFL